MDLPLEIDAVEAAQLCRLPGNLLLDVREAHELAICQIKGSMHIPMGEVPRRLEELPGNQPIYVLCHHGGRSMRVTQFLRANGFPQVTNIAGGIESWAETVDPTVPRY